MARRDACLSVSDLDAEIKQSLRVQPIESSTIFGDKFPEIVKQYKDGLARKSLQMAVVGANKPQPSSFGKKNPKATESSSKPSYGGLSVTVSDTYDTSNSYSLHLPSFIYVFASGTPEILIPDIRVVY